MDILVVLLFVGFIAVVAGTLIAKKPDLSMRSQ